MNTPLVNDTFRFVRWMFQELLPEEEASYRLHRTVVLKNAVVRIGLRRQLPDEQIELLALGALLFHTGCIKKEGSGIQFSLSIARRFLQEQGLEPGKISKVMRNIWAASRQEEPAGPEERAIWRASPRQEGPEIEGLYC